MIINKITAHLTSQYTNWVYMYFLKNNFTFQLNAPMVWMIFWIFFLENKAKKVFRKYFFCSLKLKIGHHYSFQDETWPTFSNLFLWFAAIAIFPQPVQLVSYLFYLGPWERMMQRKREEQNEIGKSYKNGPQGRASVYLYQHRQHSTPLCGAPGTTEMDGLSEAL